MRRPKIVEEASKILNLDIETTQQALGELGIKIKYKDMNVRKAKLTYPQAPLNLDIYIANAPSPESNRKT